MANKLILNCIFLLFLPISTFGANILGLMGGSSTSHHVWNKVIFHNLAQRGHNLTVLSPDVDTEVPQGLHYIRAEKVYPTIAERVSKSNKFGMDSLTATISFYGFGNASCTGFYISEGFQVLLNYPEDFKFDLILVDYIFEPCLLGFIHKFNYPLTVTVNPFSIPTYIYDFIGGHTMPSYVPHVNVEYDVEMSFPQRVHNFLVYLWADWYRKNRFVPRQEAAMRIAFNDSTLPKTDILQKSIVLALTNTHYSIEKMEPLPPNIIPVGGLQIEATQPLAKDVKSFIESSGKGTILFSLGTVLKSEYLDKSRQRSFIDAFTVFPDYNFIWKADSDFGLKLPANVKTFSWLNQSDILAHPKVKAFISHCGLLGTQEAAWHGKPVIGIPFYSDQYRNLRNGIRAGTSIKLDYFSISKSTVKAALKEILENPKYEKNARKRSQLFRDQPEPPIDRAIFWIEWVMRRKGDLSAIQLPINDLGVIVSNSYDVIGFLCLLVWAFFMFLFFLIRKTFRKSKRQKQD